VYQLHHGLYYGNENQFLPSQHNNPHHHLIRANG
jgi:hypothetical protein